MNLAERQKILASLYTNKSLLDEYLLNTNGDINKDELNLFSESLLKKRLHAVRNILPLSFGINEAQLTSKFFDYASHSPVQGYHLKHQQDALSFGNYVKKNYQNEVNAFTNAVLMYELFLIEVYLSKGFIKLHRSSYKIHMMRLNDTTFNPVYKGSTIYLFWRFDIRSNWRNRIV